MTTICTDAHVGSDGLLRLAVPTRQRDEDVRVILVVEPASVGRATDDRWAACRDRLRAAGFHVPLPSAPPFGPFDALELPGPPASQALVEDRR